MVLDPSPHLSLKHSSLPSYIYCSLPSYIYISYAIGTPAWEFAALRHQRHRNSRLGVCRSSPSELPPGLFHDAGRTWGCFRHSPAEQAAGTQPSQSLPLPLAGIPALIELRDWTCRGTHNQWPFHASWTGRSPTCPCSNTGREGERRCSRSTARRQNAVTVSHATTNAVRQSTACSPTTASSRSSRCTDPLPSPALSSKMFRRPRSDVRAQNGRPSCSCVSWAQPVFMLAS